MNQSTRNILIIGGFATFVVLPLAIWSILSILQSKPATQTVDLSSDTAIINTIEQYNGSDQTYAASNMRVEEKKVIEKDWIIAHIRLLDQVDNSDSAVFRALLHSTGAQLELAAYSFDTFHDEDLPAGVPKSVSSQLNKPFTEIKGDDEK